MWNARVFQVVVDHVGGVTHNLYKYCYHNYMVLRRALSNTAQQQYYTPPTFTHCKKGVKVPNDIVVGWSIQSDSQGRWESVLLHSSKNTVKRGHAALPYKNTVIYLYGRWPFPRSPQWERACWFTRSPHWEVAISEVSKLEVWNETSTVESEHAAQ